MYRHKRKNLTLIHLNGLAGRQIIRQKYHRLFYLDGSILSACQIIDDSFGDIQNVGAPGFHVVVVHSGEHLRIIVSHLVHRVLRVALSGNHILNVFQIPFVLQHHLVYVEYHGLFFANAFKRIPVQDIKLSLCLRHRQLKPPGFALYVLYLCLFQSVFLFSIHIYSSNRNSLQNAFSGTFNHYVLLTSHR